MSNNKRKKLNNEGNMRTTMKKQECQKGQCNGPRVQKKRKSGVEPVFFAPLPLLLSTLGISQINTEMQIIGNHCVKQNNTRGLNLD